MIVLKRRKCELLGNLAEMLLFMIVILLMLVIALKEGVLWSTLWILSIEHLKSVIITLIILDFIFYIIYFLSKPDYEYVISIFDNHIEIWDTITLYKIDKNFKIIKKSRRKLLVTAEKTVVKLVNDEKVVECLEKIQNQARKKLNSKLKVQL